jgi:hypothetical protein
MTSSAKGIEPNRCEVYSKLLKELRNSFVSAANMPVKLYEQGKKDGLSNEEIRKLLFVWEYMQSIFSIVIIDDIHTVLHASISFLNHI